MDEIMKDATETTFEGFETAAEAVVETVADQDIMADIDTGNAKTLVIAGITILIIGTTIYVVKNKDKIAEKMLKRQERKRDKLIAKLERKYGYTAVPKENEFYAEYVDGESDYCEIDDTDGDVDQAF